MTGRTSSLVAIRSQTFGQPMNACTMIATTMTNIRKLVPQRGCNV